MLERDLILRLVQDLARVLARVLGLRKQGATPEAIAEVETASASLFGLDFRVIAALDAGLLASQLRDSERVAALARLVGARADLAEDGGDPLAAGWRRKAVELWLEAGAAGASLDDEALRAIAAHPRDDLGPRQQRLRAALG
jgi:hypothetical protein